MTIITIVAINKQKDEFGVETGLGSVDFYVDGTQNGTYSLWQWSQGGLDVTQSLSAIQSYLDSNAASYVTAVQNDVPVATGNNAIELQWVANHVTWEDTFETALTKLDNGIRTAVSVDAATYRTILQSALTVINTLPTVITDQWTKFRAAQNVTGDVSTFTLAQCRTFANEMRSWLNSRATQARYSVAKRGQG